MKLLKTSYEEKPSQEKQILEILKKHKNEWVWLPIILKTNISQYNARIYWLREKGNLIINKTEIIKKQKYSYYKLIK